jgi:hypothetical protein
MNMFGSVAKGNIEEQAASEIIKEFLRSNKSWPYTKAPKIVSIVLSSQLTHVYSPLAFLRATHTSGKACFKLEEQNY